MKLGLNFFFFRWDMSKPENHYNESPNAFTLDDIKKFASKQQYCCKNMPLLDVPLDHIVLDELHLLLRITDTLLSNIIEDAIELDDKDDYFKKKGESKGVHLASLIRLINSCGVTFTIWEKRDEDGKGTGKKDWTSLMGDEKKKLLQNFPTKLESCADVINPDTSPTTIKLWKVLKSNNTG